jgi:hypothetical protein
MAAIGSQDGLRSRRLRCGNYAPFGPMICGRVWRVPGMRSELSLATSPGRPGRIRTLFPVRR